MGVLCGALPQFMSEQPIIAQILEVLEMEIARLEQRLEEMQRELYISTSRLRVDRWERELNLVSRPDLSADKRSNSALVAFSQWDTCTVKTIQQIVLRIIGGLADVHERTDSGVVEITVSRSGDIFTNMPMCQAAVASALPAHIICEINAENDIVGNASGGYYLHGNIFIDVRGQ